MERVVKAVKWATHPKHSFVQISNNGLVKMNGKLLTRILSYENGHLYFIVDEKVMGVKRFRKYNIHTLVFDLFSGQTSKKGWHVHHKDGDASNNNISNLELVTISNHHKIHKSHLNFKKNKP